VGNFSREWRGINHDTAAFAVASIQNWWDTMGQKAYPEAHDLMVGLFSFYQPELA
jgi:hypothetical protein